MAASETTSSDRPGIAAHFTLSVETALCLAAIADLAGEPEISANDLAARFSEYAACTAGVYCPEVAFDPTAIRLRAVAICLGESNARSVWSRQVSEALGSLLMQRRTTS